MKKDELEKLIILRDKQIADLKEANAELEMIIDDYELNDMGILLSDTEKQMLTIIHQQITKISADSDVARLDKDDVKIFDSYVKDIVAIRGKMPTPKTEGDKVGEQTEAELILLATGKK